MAGAFIMPLNGGVNDMLNLNSYNHSPFNRMRVVETYLTVIVESATDVTSKLNLDIPVAILFESSTETSATLTREYPLVVEAIDTATEMLTRLIREMAISPTAIESSTEFEVTVTHTHVDTLGFSGAFKPGDKLVIDTKKMTVTLNGQNAMHMIDGDFFNLILGTNKLTYTDDASARDILTRITHRDKFLY